jgi:hypothetical protein
MAWHGLARLLMIGGLLAAAAGWWMKDALPDPGKLQQDLLEEPLQKQVRMKPFDTTVNGVDYRIQPRYRYELNAVVVSLHHSDAWWDLAHKEWGDHVNVMDLCVAWGDSVRSGAYRDVSFDNSQWECHWSYSSERARSSFRNEQVSNNHIVTDDPAIAKAMKKIQVGDQIRLSGYLVDYTTFRNGQPTGTRVSSDTRLDTGPGACEVLYIDAFEPLLTPNRGWRTAMWAGVWTLLAGVLLWLVLPVRIAGA